MNDSMFDAFFLCPSSEYYDAEFAEKVSKAISGTSKEDKEND